MQFKWSFATWGNDVSCSSHRLSRNNPMVGKRNLALSCCSCGPNRFLQQCRKLLLSLVAFQSLTVTPIIEDTTHFGQRTWRNWAGTDLESPPWGLAVIVSESGMQDPKGEKQSIVLQTTNYQCGKIPPAVQQWHLYLGYNQELSNWTYGPLNRKEFIPGMEDIKLPMAKRGCRT